MLILLILFIFLKILKRRLVRFREWLLFHRSLIDFKKPLLAILPRDIADVILHDFNLVLMLRKPTDVLRGALTIILLNHSTFHFLITLTRYPLPRLLAYP